MLITFILGVITGFALCVFATPRTKVTKHDGVIYVNGIRVATTK